MNYPLRSSQKPLTAFKSHEPTHTFIIHYECKWLELCLPSRSTVGELTDQVKNKLEPYLKSRFVCLQSSSKNEMIDYALLLSDQKLSAFKKHEEFKVYTCAELHSKGKKYSLSDFSFLKCLGQGGSASVYLVRRRTSGKLYALKQIDKEYFSQFKRMEQILREKKILSEVVKEFPFCAKLYGSFESQKHLNFLLEYYPGGELFLHLQRRKLEEHEVKLYFCEIVLTFQFLHRSKVVYRDLKPENIMVDYEGHIRLADFGLCKLNLEEQENTYSFCGSLEYMAPEVRGSAGYSYAVDFYTIGAFLYEMLVGIPPYYNNQPLYFPQKMSRPAINLIKGLIEKDPNSRISSFEVIKKNPWLDGVNWKEIYNKNYQMPIKLSLYQTYIHEEFSELKVDSMNLGKEEKFDNLFSMFEYQKKLNSFKSPFQPPENKKNKSKSKSSNKSKDSKDSKGFKEFKNSRDLKNKSRKSSCSNDSKDVKPLLKKQKPKQEYFLRNLSPNFESKGLHHQLYRSLSPPISLSRNQYR